MSESRTMTVVLSAASCAAWAFACQATGSSTTTSTTASGGAGGTTSSATTASGGAGGATSSSATTASGGAGGTTSSSATTASGGAGGATSSSATSSSTTTGSSSTGTACPGDRLFLLATAASSVTCATFTNPGGWVTSTSPGTGSTERPAVAMIDAQKGAGVFFQGPAPGALREVHLANGGCSAPSDVPLAQTRTAPSAAVLNGVLWVIFQGAVGTGTDHPYLVGWSGSSWLSPTQVGADVFSPQTGALSANSSDLEVIYGGTDKVLYHVPVSGQPIAPMCYQGVGMSCEQVNSAISPAATGLDAGGWLVVFQGPPSDTSLRWLVQTGTPAPSAPIAGASSSSPVSLARTVGGAVLAFRDATTGAVSTALFDGQAWGAVQTLPGDPTTPASPAVARGVCGHTAELGYVDAVDGSVKHSFLEAGAWSAPATVGGTAIQGLAITSFP